MNRQAFLTAYRAMLFDCEEWAKEAAALESFLDKVRESIAGRPPHYDLATSPIACETWCRLNCELPLTMEKLKGLRE